MCVCSYDSMTAENMVYVQRSLLGVFFPRSTWFIRNSKDFDQQECSVC